MYAGKCHAACRLFSDSDASHVQFYACALHNETLPLIFADVPGELGLGPNPCFPACSKLGPYAYFNPQFTSLYTWRGAGTSSYHALQVTIRHGMSRGLQWDFNYTYAKSIVIGSTAG